LCKTEFLNYLRVREWQDLVGQLRQVARTLSITYADTPAEPERIHQALLAGLLSHVGLKDPAKHEYLGARGARFAIFPGSALFKKPPRFVMAAELVETSRLWARIAARVEPEWVEALAGHLVKRSYSEPHWEKRQGAVMAFERVTLYGVPLVANRKVNYGRIDPPVARDLFIRHALVEGDWSTHHEFFHANRALLDEVEELERRVRRRDILVDDETLYAFYDQRLPADVVSARHFDAWWKKTRRSRPELLSFEASMLVNEGAGAVSAVDYPSTWHTEGLALPLTYQFEPGSHADGVTVHIPVAVLGRVPADPFGWQIPGLRVDLVTALIRALPKNLRRNFVPAPDFAAAAVAEMTPGAGPLPAALEKALLRLGGVAVPRDAWDLGRVPDHLTMTFAVEDDDGTLLAEGKDLDALKRQLRPQVQATLAAAVDTVVRSGLTAWTVGTLPQTVSRPRHGYTVTGYPALVDEGDSVAVRVMDTPAEQRRAMWRGTRRLLLLTIASPVKAVNARLSNQDKLVLQRGPYPNAAALMDDCLAGAVDALVAQAGGPAWDEAGFARLREHVRAGLADTLYAVVSEVRDILAAAYELEQRLRNTTNLSLVAAYTDVRAQLGRLVHAGFVAETGWQRLGDLPRYLAAIGRRLDKLPAGAARDRDQLRRVAEVEDAYRELRAEVPDSEALRDIRWMIEELRVSVFAQSLGTPYPVSEKRIYRAMDEVPE
jgi:ATP-dependent helicase HrpA